MHETFGYRLRNGGIACTDEGHERPATPLCEFDRR